MLTKQAEKMNREELVKTIMADAAESSAVLGRSAEKLSDKMARAGEMIAESVRGGGIVLACGNGGSAADAQHLAAELVGRFLLERDAYPAVALTTDTSVMTSLANDYGYDAVFERQVLALGRPGSVLVAISTSGNSKNVVLAMKAAAARGMKCIALTGGSGGDMAGLADILLNADSASTPRIQETHGFIVHALCDIAEKLLSK
jgi:phosphoheptose isomerase